MYSTHHSAEKQSTVSPAVVLQALASISQRTVKQAENPLGVPGMALAAQGQETRVANQEPGSRLGVLVSPTLLCVALIAVPAAADAQNDAATPPFTLGVTVTGYIERSEPELDGSTLGGALVFAARLHPQLSVYIEGGRARFYGDGQEGHRDFFLGGLLGFHLQQRADGLVLLAGATVLHSERHKFFGDLATNEAALTLGLEYVWLVDTRVVLAAAWRTDLASRIRVHRPGFSMRLRF